MKATELRIGNLVEETHSGEFGKVDMVVLSIIERMSNHSYRPIPLTEEWLVRFGFKKTHSELTYKEYDYKKFGAEINSDIMTVSYNYGSKVEWVNFKHIKHVHQLQNFYFALTGEELELKP